jgi:hypothetical protein
MGLTIRNGYLLDMPLHDAYGLCVDLGMFATERATQAVAAKVAKMVVESHDNRTLSREHQLVTVSQARQRILVDHTVANYSRARNPEMDMETEVFLQPHPMYRKMTLARLVTEMDDVRAWWKRQPGVSPYSYDSVTGPEDEDDEQWAHRGEAWTLAMKTGHALCFTVLGPGKFPNPPREAVLANMPSWEERVRAAARHLLDLRWASTSLDNCPSAYMRWREDPATQNLLEGFRAKAESNLPNPFPVEILYPPKDHCDS